VQLDRGPLPLLGLNRVEASNSRVLTTSAAVAPGTALICSTTREHLHLATLKYDMRDTSWHEVRPRSIVAFRLRCFLSSGERRKVDCNRLLPHPQMGQDVGWHVERVGRGRDLSIAPGLRRDLEGKCRRIRCMNQVMGGARNAPG